MDDSKKTIVADDDWWEKKIKENARYTKFKDKDLSLIWFRYGALFLDIVATGERACAATQEYMSTVGTELHDEEENNIQVHLSNESGDDENMQNTDAAIFSNASINKRESSDGICIGSQVKKERQSVVVQLH